MNLKEQEEILEMKRKRDNYNFKNKRKIECHIF